MSVKTKRPASGRAAQADAAGMSYGQYVAVIGFYPHCRDRQ